MSVYVGIVGAYMEGGGLVGMRGRCFGVEERRFRPLVGSPSNVSPGECFMAPILLHFAQMLDILR